MNTLAVDLSDTHMVGRALRVLHNELYPPSFILPLLYACKWSLREKTGLCVNRRKDGQSSHSKILELRQLKSSFSKTPGLPATGSLLSCLWHNYLYIGVRVPVDSVISGCLDQGHSLWQGNLYLMSVKWEHREISSWDEFHVCNKGTTPSQSTYSLPQHSELRVLDMCLSAIKRVYSASPHGPDICSALKLSPRPQLL